MSVQARSSERRIKSPAPRHRRLVVAAYFAVFSLLLLLPHPLWIFRGLGRRAASWWNLDWFTTLSYAVHFGGFGLLVLLLIWASPKRATSHFVWLAVAAASYGMLVEVLQIPIPNRAFDVLDIAANSAGCLIAAIFYALVRRRARATRPHTAH